MADIPAAASSASPLNSAPAFSPELRELHIRREYAAGKNSFVLGGEILCGLPLETPKGGRKTLLDLQGRGSLRHIWHTFEKNTPCPYRLEFFVDGERRPSIRGTMPDLVAAALRCRQDLVPVAASEVARRSFNLYLPVPFESSLRVEAVYVADNPTGFFQLDYRLDDDSMKAFRLTQQGEGADARFDYVISAMAANTKRLDPRSPASGRPERKTLRIKGDGIARLGAAEPAIIRRLTVEGPVADGARLRMRFDGETTPAVDVVLADFLGPFSGPAITKDSCSLPMPFRQGVELEIAGSDPDAEREFAFEYEPAKAFQPAWLYFHAKSARTELTDGHAPHLALYTRGSGHWLGMSLFNTGHDHGGGDFAVIDGETNAPRFLHGANGEDYFSFAWFGKGQNLPYSESIDNEKGRIRLHLENPYPFRESIEISFATLERQSPRSVAYWYQDSAADLTEMDIAPRGREWKVFGPAPVPTLAGTGAPDLSDVGRLFAALPESTRLDAGEEAVARRTLMNAPQTGVFHGWGLERAVGPHLNLTYIYRHVMDLGPLSFIGYEPRCMMAQTHLESRTARDVILQLSYDDPIEVRLNGQTLYADLDLHAGFVTKRLATRLREGSNELLVRMLDTPSLNQSWAGISLRVLEAEGREFTQRLQTGK